MVVIHFPRIEYSDKKLLGTIKDLNVFVNGSNTIYDYEERDINCSPGIRKTGKENVSEI